MVHPMEFQKQGSSFHSYNDLRNVLCPLEENTRMAQDPADFTSSGLWSQFFCYPWILGPCRHPTRCFLQPWEELS
jgi:hypothetical protein